VAVSQGWRWVFWWCTIFMGVITLVMIFCLEETKYTPPPLIGHAVPVSNDDGQLTTVSSTNKDQIDSTSIDASEIPLTQHRRLVDIDTTIPIKSYWKRHAFWSLEKQASTEHRSLWQHFYQPFQILFTFPAVMFAALQYGFAIAMLAILAVTQATLYPFPPYNFTPVGVGNMNLPPAIGAILGSLFGGPLVDYFILFVAKRRGGIYEPETRLWLFLVPGLAMVVGALMYGLTIAKV